MTESSHASATFWVEEWKATREQVHRLLEAIWRFEAASILGLGGFYSWFFARGNTTWEVAVGRLVGIEGGGTSLDTACLATVPAIFAAFIFLRLKVEYGILKRLGEYTQVIEGRIYRFQPLEHTAGWQTFIESNSPDKVGIGIVWRRYSNTFTAFFVVVCICVAIALANWLDYLIGGGIVQSVWSHVFGSGAGG